MFAFFSFFFDKTAQVALLVEAREGFINYKSEAILCMAVSTILILSAEDMWHTGLYDAREFDPSKVGLQVF